MKEPNTPTRKTTQNAPSTKPFFNISGGEAGPSFFEFAAPIGKSSTGQSNPPADIAASKGGEVIQLQRRGTPRRPPSARRQRQLQEWARRPANFITRWRRLNDDEHSVVILAMDEYYGQTFTNEFVRYAEAGQLSAGGHLTSHRVSGDLGELTPERLQRHGYQLEHMRDRTLARRSEVWVHPSGHTITIGPARRDTDSAAAEQTIPTPPASIDVDHPEVTLGRRIGMIENTGNIENFFPGCDWAALHEDGSVVCYRNDGGSYTAFRLQQDPAVYQIYDEEGNNTETTWASTTDYDAMFREALQSRTETQESP